MQISTFGKILLWSINKLEEVKEDMVANYTGSEEITNNISVANYLIRHVLRSAQTDKVLQEKFNQIPEAEYRALIDMIQNDEIDLTDELRKDTNLLLDSVQDESLETIQQAKMLVDRMHAESSKKTD